MANGSYGESTLQVVTQQTIKELEMVLIPKVQEQLVTPFFGDQRIFVNVPQYHWHVQGANEEARQHLVALTQRLQEFGHQIEEREMQLWHRLGSAVEMPEMEQK